MKLNSLKVKFLAGFLPLFIGSFAVFFAISYYMTSNALIKNADSIAQEIGTSTATKLEKNFQRKELAIASLAHNDGMINGTLEHRMELLNEVKQNVPGFAMVCYTDLNGRAVNETGKVMERASREYFKAVVSTKKPYMTGPSVSGTSGKLITVIAYPLLDKGEIKGVIYGTVELDDISEMTGKISYMDTGYVYIADQTGVVIAYAKNPDDVGKLDLSKETSNKTIDKALVKGFEDVTSQDKQISTEYTTSEGIASQAVLTPIHLENRNWVVVSAAPLNEIRADANSLIQVMSLIGILMVLAISVVIWVVAKKMCDPVVALREDCFAINNNDLRSRPLSVSSDDELGDLARGFSEMRGNIRRLITSIQKNSDNVAKSAQNLNEASSQSAEASNHVAQQITDITAGIATQSENAETADKTAQDIAERTGAVAHSSEAIATVTKMTVDSVDKGRGAINQVVSAMEKINDSTHTVQGSIAELSKSSDEISKIVEMITGIAEQTNLLALNAAIEAARAGEAGRGFAVVADEVRKLAEESATSTQQISDLVAKIQSDMKKAVAASDMSTESVASSIESVKSADEVFESIKIAIDSLSNGISEVSESIKSIAEGTKNVQVAVEKINSVSTSNAERAQSVSAATEEQSASTEEIAAATRQLSDQAVELAKEVEKFKV